VFPALKAITMNYDDLLQKVAEHVSLFYVEHTDKRLLYHNHTHVTEMLDDIKKMAAHYKLNKRDYFIVCAATWFHDTGYFFPDIENHENRSAELAGDFLKSIGVDEEAINEIMHCILATQMPQQPVSLLEKIVCDADLFNLGTIDFKEHNSRLRKECENLKGTEIKRSKWREKSIELLESHQYHTDYCRSFLDSTKALNLEQLKQKQQAKFSGLSDVAPENSPAGNHDKSVDIPAAGKNKKQVRRPDRGIETMFRVSFASHQKLSALADNKAHIMISVNSIIISVTIGLVLHNFTANNYLIIPTMILLLVNVATIIFAVLATRPKIHPGFFTKEQVERKTVNLLFYGSFYKMKYNDYEKAMLDMMKDSEFLYTTMIKDIYWQGRVMGRKFRLLHFSYNIFMYGIAVAVVAYAIWGMLNL